MRGLDCHGTTIATALELGQRRLGHDRGRDVQILLSLATGVSRSQVLAGPEKSVSRDELERFSDLLERRRDGEPIAYITGEREFWSLPLKVSSATLIPRLETETLVEQALARIAEDGLDLVLDLGTGSGAVALAVASERPRCKVTGTDVSAEALAVAEQNRLRLGLENVCWRRGEWYDAIEGLRFSLILSNPPYVAEGDPHLREGDLPFEPPVALSSGNDGLDAIRAIVSGAGHHLEPGGWLLLEHGYDQQEAVCGLLEDQGFSSVNWYADLAGQPRVSLGRHNA